MGLLPPSPPLFPQPQCSPSASTVMALPSSSWAWEVEALHCGWMGGTSLMPKCCSGGARALGFPTVHPFLSFPTCGGMLVLHDGA